MTTITERIAKFKEKREKASPQEWTLGDCSNGGLILIRQPLEGQRHAIQSHLQVLPAQDAEFIAAAANDALPLIDELQALLATAAADRNAHYKLCRVYEKRLEAAEALLKSVHFGAQRVHSTVGIKTREMIGKYFKDYDASGERAGEGLLRESELILAETRLWIKDLPGATELHGRIQAKLAKLHTHFKDKDSR